MILCAKPYSLIPISLSKPFHSTQGQALTELLAIALVLIPLFLLIPMLAKYQDITHATQMAGRYAAFTAATRGRTLNTTDRKQYLIDNIRRRIFSTPNSPVKTNDVAGNFKADQNLFWRDPHDHPLISDFNDIQLSFGTPPGLSENHAFIAASDGQPFVLHNELNLAARGIYTVNVSVKLANLPTGLRFYEPFDQLNLSITRSTSLLLNPWTAWSPSNIETHLTNATLFPATDLQAVTPLVNTAVQVIDLPGNITAPQLGKLDFWRDVVPTDRLNKTP